MQQLQLDEPTPRERLPVSEVDTTQWFDGPSCDPPDKPWVYLTTQRSKELWRLSESFRRLFNPLGDWFSASRDRPERIAAFRKHVQAETKRLDQRVYVIRGRGRAAAFTTVEGFLDRWPYLTAEPSGEYVVLPLDVSFLLRINGIGSARIAHRKR